MPELQVATSPVIYNVTMTDADTEYRQKLHKETKKFLIKCRGDYDIKLSYVSGIISTTYLTIGGRQVYWEDIIKGSNIVLYFQCATANQVVEIVVWV